MLENMTTGEKVIAGATAIGIAALVFHKPTRNAVGLSDGRRKRKLSKKTLTDKHLEFAIFGIPPEENLDPNDQFKHMERFLMDKDSQGNRILDRKYAERAKEFFENKGFKKVRIMVIDMATPPNFVKAINK